MSFIGSDPSSLQYSISSSLEDFLVKKLLVSHDPDGRRLDSALLLLAVENVMLYSTASQALVPDLHFYPNAKSEVSNIEVVGTDEPLGHTIGKISCKMFCKCSEAGNLHSRTMSVFDLLENYRFDDKAGLVLAAFARNYGEIWLLKQLCPGNSLAVSVAMFKNLPVDLTILLVKPQFKALNSLIKIMVDLTNIIMEYESLPLSQVELEYETRTVTKYQICVAVYWIIRSVLTFSCRITELTAMKSEQVYSDSTIIATWELSSLANRLRGMYSPLKRQVVKCHEQTDTKLYEKLMNIFKETNAENQEVLRMLFALRDDFPLLDCPSQAKFGVPKLRNMVVVLLISKPELLPIDESLFLIQQTYDHPQHKIFQESYKLVWVPIPASNLWTDAEMTSFRFLSHTLPWYSIRQPRFLNSVVVKFIKQVWNYKDDEPVMVVLDPQGNVTNLNAIDMLYIWGAKAYPFSDSREKELWQEEKWRLQLLVDEIDPLLTSWVEESRYICIYGSQNIDWILEFNAKMKEIKEASGVELEMVYVGKRNPKNKQVRDIVVMDEDVKLTTPLSLTQMGFFWIRLECIRRSKLKIGNSVDTDQILREVSALLDMDDSDKDWVVMGSGKSMEIVRFESNKLMECLNTFPAWVGNVSKLGFLGALRNVVEPPIVAEPCGHFDTIRPFTEEEMEEMVVCEKCKHPMKKFIMYE